MSTSVRGLLAVLAILATLDEFDLYGVKSSGNNHQFGSPLVLLCTTAGLKFKCPHTRST